MVDATTTPSWALQGRNVNSMYFIESTCVLAGVCPWPGPAGDRTLSCASSCVAATDPAEDNSLPQVPLQGGPALPANAKLCAPLKGALLVQLCTRLLSTCISFYTAHSVLVSSLAGSRLALVDLGSVGISAGHRCSRARGNRPFPGTAGRAAALPRGCLSRPCPQSCAASGAGVPAGALAGGAECGSSGPGRGQAVLACILQSGQSQMHTCTSISGCSAAA